MPRISPRGNPGVFENERRERLREGRMGLVTDSPASKQEASSRSDGSKPRVHPSGLRGVGRQEVSGGQASLRIKGAGYRNRETQTEPERGAARLLSPLLGALSRGTPPVLSPFSCLSLCLSSPGAQEPGSPSEPRR